MAKPAPLLVDPNSPAFSDTHAAARAIGNNFSDKGGEQAAAIIKGTDGQYRYTTSVPGTQDNFSMHVGLRQGESLAGIMHSHPGTDNDAKVFSPNDIDTANQLKVPSYVQFSGQNNAIRMYTPGVTKTRSVPSQGYQAGNMQVADGDPLPAPPKSMPAAPDQDIPPSAPPVAVTPVQGSQVSANDEFAGFSPADEFAGFAAAPTSGATADFSDDDSPEAAEAKALTGGSEAALHAASTIPAAMGGGLTYLGALAATGDPAAAEAVRQSTQNALTYQPRTRAGQGVTAAGAQAVNAVAAPLGAAATKVGEGTAEETGSPLLGAAEYTGLNAIPMLMGGGGVRTSLAAPEEATVLGGIRAASPPDHPAGVTRADYAPKAPEAAPAPPAAAAPPSATPARVPVPGKPHITPKATEQVPPTAAAAAEHIRAQEGEMGVAGAPEPPAAAAPPPAAAAPPPATPSAAPGPHGNPPPASIHDPDFFTPPDNQDLKSAPAGPQEQAARLAAVERGAPTLPQVRDSAITNDYAAQGRDWTGKQSGDPAATAQVAAEGQALHSEASRISQSTGGQIGTGEAADRVRGQAYQDWHDTTVNALKGHIDNAYAAEDAQARQIATPGSNLKGILTDDSLIDSANAGSARSSTIALGKKMGVDLTDPNATMNAYQVEQLRKHAGSIYGNAPRFAQAIKNAADADLPQGAYVQARALNKLKSDMFDNRDGINQLGASKDIDPNTGKPRPENRPVKAGDVMSTIEGMDPEQIAHIGRTMKRSSSVLKALGDDAAAENITDKAYKAAQNLQSHFTERWNEEAAKGGGWNTRRANSFLRDNQEKLAATFSPDQMHQMRNVNSAAHVLDLDKRYKGAFAQFRSGASWLRQRLGRTAEGVMTDLIPMGNTIGEMTGLSEKARNFLGGANKAEVPKGFTRPLGQRMPGQGGWIGDRTAGAEPGGKQNIVAPKGITHEYDPEEGTHTVTSANGTTHAYDQGNDIRVNETNTTGGGGKGEGTARMAQLAETAHARGGKLISDPTVSAPQSHIYEEKLGKERGYNVERNPNATPSTSEAGGWVSDAPNKPVFTVGPRRVGGVPQAGAVPGETTPMGRSIFGGRQAGAVGDLTRRPQGGNPYESAGNPYNTAPVQRDVWGNERAKQDRSTPAGARLFGGKQRGAVGLDINPKAETPLAGAPEGDRPNATARGAAAAYMKSAKMPYQPLADYKYIPPEVASKVAEAYDAMKHDPTNPKVAAAYNAFKAETLAQYKQMVKSGVNVTLDKDYPYKAPRDVQTDVRDNNHMSIFPTDQGFGEPGSVPSDHPMLEASPVQMGGKDATYNDLFRATHDYYGHVANGNGFRANGEYNAWRAHRQMYSDAAKPAMDSETLGQNSWVNNQPKNAGASQMETAYAEQKAGLLPRKTVADAVGGVNAAEHHVTNLLTEPERKQLRADTTQRLMSAFHDAPATQEYAAAALAGAAKRGWYRNSAQAIANTFGPDAPRFSALLSSMSPQVSVQTNFANALRTFINWDKAGRPTDPTAIRSIMENSSQKGASQLKGTSNVLDAWVNNAVRSLTAADPANVQLSGPKVHSFYNNLHGNVNEVTNDAWMAAFAKIDPAKLAGGLNKSGPGKSASYLALSAKVRDAAKMLTHLTGETWTPAEVQETVWSWAKAAYEHAEETGDRTIPELVKNGDITDDLIKSTPDFHQLFGSPEHRGFLESSRYADNAKRVAGWQGHSTGSAGAGEARTAAAKTLEPHLLAAANRLEKLRQERNATTSEEAPF